MNMQQIRSIIRNLTSGRTFEVRKLNKSGKLFIFFSQTDALPAQLHLNSDEDAEIGDDAEVSNGMIDAISSHVFGFNHVS